MISGVGRSSLELGFIGFFRVLFKRRVEWGSLELGWGMFGCETLGGGGPCSFGRQTCLMSCWRLFPGIPGQIGRMSGRGPLVRTIGIQ